MTEEKKKRVYRTPNLQSAKVQPMVQLSCPTGNADGCGSGNFLCDTLGCIPCVDECPPNP